MHELTIHPELKNLLPPLSVEEYAGLEASILKDGCLSPLTAWNEILVDGHHRHEICTKHKVPYTVNRIACDDIVDAKIWALRNQGNRRNLTSFQRIEIALGMKEKVAAQSKERQLRKPSDFVPQTFAEQKETRQVLAGIAGVSHTTLDKAEFVLDNGDDETKEKLRRGEKGVSIHGEYTRLKAEANTEATEEEPDPSEYPSELGSTETPAAEMEETADVYPPLSRPIPEKDSQFVQTVKLQNIPLNDPQRLIACLFDLFDAKYRAKLAVDLLLQMKIDDGEPAVKRILAKLTKSFA